MGRQALVLLVVVAVFGILVPWYKGFTFLQPWVIAVYGAMALLFVAPAAAEFWSVSQPLDTGGAVLARLFAIVGYGWGVSTLMLVSGIVTLNLAYWRGQVLIPAGTLLAAVLVFSLTASTAVAALCAVLGLRMPARSVKGILRLFFLAVLLLAAFGSRFLPESWQIMVRDLSTRRAMTRLAWEGAVVAAVVGVGLMVMLVKARRPAAQAGSSGPA